jgi:guanylate kinase
VRAVSDQKTISGRRGLVICVSGPSGVGKGTVIGKVREIAPEMAYSVSVTTRPPRIGEQEGVDYFFRSQADFEVMLAQDEILESDIYCGHYYGTPRKFLDELVSRGIDVLMDITIHGSLAVMANYAEAIPVFLLPPSFTELKRRLLKRGTDDPSEQEIRLAKARDEIGMARLFRYLIVNDDLEETARSILAIAQAEHCRSERLPGLEESILAL